MALNFKPGPVGQAFLDDRHFVKVICGPVGGGKSTDALMELFYRAIDQTVFNGVRRTKFVVMRNTSKQLKDTVKPLIDQWFCTLADNQLGSWRLTDGVFEMKFKLPDGTIVHSEFCLLHADTPDDVRRLLSFECSAAWIEEMREIDQTIFEGLQGRVSRFPNKASGGVKYPGVIGSTNPPPMGSWLQEYMANPPKNAAVFMQPPAMLENGEINRGQQEGTPAAENLDNLPSDYYDNLMEGKTEDWIDVFLKNKFGAGGFGMPVFAKTFRRDFHTGKGLRPISTMMAPLIVGADNGLTGAAVIGQLDARGRVNILGEAYVPDGQTMGYVTFMDRILTPYLNSRFGLRPEAYRFVMDPACWSRSQVNEVTIEQEVRARGYTTTKPTTNDPEKRIGAVEGLLSRAIDGGPGLLIDEENCPHLIKAMDWGYRNKKQTNGVVVAVPEKNHYSHVADALQYLALHYNLAVNPAAAVFRPQAREVKKVKWAYV